MNRILTAGMALFLLSSIPAGAIPSNPILRTETLPDGSEINVRLLGDEFHHIYQSEDGLPLAKGEDGFFYYLTVDSEGNPVSSGIRPGKAGVSFFNKYDKDAVYKALNEEWKLNIAAKKIKTRAPGTSTFPSKGDIRGIVVLVEYQDVKFTTKDVNKAFDRLLNEPGYSDNDATGSVYDWFTDNSKGQFNPVFDVYGPLTLDHEMAYYGRNSGNVNDENAHYMTIEACRQLDKDVDFRIYDCDNDGYIDNVYVFYAGYGEPDGGTAESVWPHSWDIGTFTNEVFDGVKLDHYACSNELDGKSVLTSIGVFCHEFGHVLGLPDLYSTVYNDAFTPGDWDVMGSGSYNNNSRTPPLYSSYERYYLGWLTPRELTEKGEDICLKPMIENEACIINTERSGEYYLFENRQKEGWDAYLPYHGMLVWHIDFDINYWAANVVNNDPEHQRIDIVEADGTQSLASVTGDVFPGARRVTSFTDDTRPNMLSWNGVRQNKPITEIKESDGNIYFKVSGGSGENGIQNITADNGFSIHINGNTVAVENAQNQEISVYALDGRLVGKFPTVGEKTVFNLPSKGCYLVSDGIYVRKILLF